MRVTLLILFGSLICGVAGFALAWGVWHIVNDHAALHALINIVAQAQRAGGK